MEIIKRDGSYRIIKFSDKFFVLDYSNQTFGIAVKTYINEAQAVSEFETLCKYYDTNKRIDKSKLESMISNIY
ncbi:hypothetical protein [Staphylococcus xylosus]|uniref:hypothetical protein n=1 Tax=Staphylococcus xylosus TaxID=1288 RepID=UPI0011C7DB0A|nr:hypothetical protein [Staphylococcus xylosus]